MKTRWVARGLAHQFCWTPRCRWDQSQQSVDIGSQLYFGHLTTLKAHAQFSSGTKNTRHPKPQMYHDEGWLGNILEPKWSRTKLRNCHNFKQEEVQVLSGCPQMSPNFQHLCRRLAGSILRNFVVHCRLTQFKHTLDMHNIYLWPICIRCIPSLLHQFIKTG